MSAASTPRATDRARQRLPALQRLASLRISLVAIGWLAAAVAYSFDAGVPATGQLAAPLALIAVNLVAAIAANPAFRARPALLVFHVALIALVLLVALGRLTYLRGRMELTTGVPFTGALIEREAGPWHPSDPAAASFVSEGFEIDYDAGMRRQATRNVVRWHDRDGRPHRAVIGDQTPLEVAGYRFYTSPNKGFAPRFIWQPAGGAPVEAAIHLPAFPVFQYGQRVDWRLPGTAIDATIELDLPELPPLDRPWRFALPDRRAITVTVGGRRVPMVPGQGLELAGGVLRYDGLTTWMGYTVDYDRTLPWLLASGVLAACALGWHLQRRFAAHPWQPWAPGEGGER